MLVKLLSHYYRSRLRGSFRLTKFIDKVHSLKSVDVDCTYGRINVDLTTAAGQAIVSSQGTHEGEIIAKHARGVCYDIGANFGFYSVLMAKAGQVYAFEPNPEVFKHLVRTSQFHGITPFNLALSDESGMSDFYVFEENTFSSFIDWTHDADMSGITKFAGDAVKTSCSISTLDAFVESRHLPLPDFIKIDVEGAEIKVFRGARKTIERSRPVIYFEVSKTLWRKIGTSAQEGFEFLDSLGYKLFKDQTPLENLEMEWDNVLAIPSRPYCLQTVICEPTLTVEVPDVTLR
jgi:FkbM family methyltransferase